MDGDSITYGYDVTTSPGPVKTPYPSYLSTLAGLPTKNIGQVGEYLRDMDANYATQAAPFFDSVHNGLTILGGTNDIAFLPVTVSQLQTYIQSYCGKARSTGFKVYPATLLPRTISGTSWTAGMETIRTSYNAWLITNASTFADGVLDTASIPQAQDPTNTAYFQDGLHPTALLDTFIAATFQSFFGYATDAFAFNPTPVVGSGNTFFDNNKTFETASAGVVTTVIGSSPITGKKVFSIVFDADPNSGNAAIGLGNATGNTGGLGLDAGSKSIGYLDNGGLVQSNAGAGANAAVYGRLSTPAIIIDEPNAKVWVTMDGINFYGGTGPLTRAQVEAGTSGISLASMKALGAIYPMAGVATGGGTGVKRLRIVGYQWVLPNGYSQL
jgi:hypothetical protein